MKNRALVALALLSLIPVLSLGAGPTMGELSANNPAAMPLCNCNDPANREICQRLAISGSDPGQFNGGHGGGMQRGPAGFQQGGLPQFTQPQQGGYSPQARGY